MLELINISSYTSDIELIENNPLVLQQFLAKHKVDGIELMFYDEWDETLYPKEIIKGVHLRFWPAWLDFWRGNRQEVLKQFGSEEEVIACYGGVTKEDWLALYRENIRRAVRTGAQYVVFHVSHARIPELFSWEFSASSRDVIEATIELVNELVKDIPPQVALLFENLWWPGLTLKDPSLVAELLDHVTHPNIGIMLDVGHLMNTNTELHTEEDGVDYILEVVNSLGEYKSYVRGIHLHKSLSGEYRKESINKETKTYDMGEIMNHVLQIDQHEPFTTNAVKRLIDGIQPEFLVHEFMYSSLAEWSEKITLQKAALAQIIE